MFFLRCIENQKVVGRLNEGPLIGQAERKDVQGWNTVEEAQAVMSHSDFLDDYLFEFHGYMKDFTWEVVEQTITYNPIPKYPRISDPKEIERFHEATHAMLIDEIEELLTGDADGEFSMPSADIAEELGAEEDDVIDAMYNEDGTLNSRFHYEQGLGLYSRC